MSAVVLRLPTGYEGQPSTSSDRPVSRREIAQRFGVSVRTVDRWVERGMPQVNPEDRFSRGCWIQVGPHRRFYPERVAVWLGD